MSMMTCGYAWACEFCGCSVLAGTVVHLCATSVISVLGDEPWEGTGLKAVPEMPSNKGAWFENYTSYMNSLIELVLYCAKDYLLTLLSLYMVSYWLMTDSFFQLLFDLVLCLLYLVVSKKASCPSWNWGEALPVVRFRTNETDTAWWIDGTR